MLCNLGDVPVETVVVVTQDTDGPEAAMWQMLQHPAQLRKLPRPMVADPVPGHSHEIRSERLNPPEGFDQVGVVNSGSYVHITDLCDGAAFQCGRKIPDRQNGIGEFEPVRFDAPRVHSQCESSGSGDCQCADGLTSSELAGHGWLGLLRVFVCLPPSPSIPQILRAWK